MSILDDAIREHLELKRAHGADDSEVKKLEDEAFGPPQRPDEADPFAEAPGRAFVVSGPEAAMTGLAIIGRVGGERLSIGDELSVSIAELDDARSGGLAKFI